MAVCKDGIQRHAVLASQALPEVYICLGPGHCVLAHDDLLNSRTWRNSFQRVFLFGSVCTGFMISGRAVAWRFVSDVAKDIWRGYSHNGQSI